MPWFGVGSTHQQCANSTRGTTESDFQTICCDGNIVDTRKDLFRDHGPVDLADLVCCRLQGPQMGGLLPLPNGPATGCSTGTHVPLASLAATNTRNAQGYLVTYTSASYGIGTTGDFVPTQTPYCLWAYTASAVAMSNITVPAAQIASLSSTSYLLGTIATSSGGRSSGQTTSIMPSPTGRATSLSSRHVLKKLYFLQILYAGAVMLQP